MIVHVVAFSIVEPNSMAGGYRIAIELINRWSKRPDISFIVHTNLEGKKMISRYVPNRRNVKFKLTFFPTFLSKLCLNHALVSMFAQVLLSIVGTVKVSSEKTDHKRTLIFSVTPFLPDVAPGLLMKLHMKNAKWFSAHAMFAPNPLKGGFSVPKSRMLPDLRSLGVYFNEALTYPLLKRHADLISETNELDRKRSIAEGFSPNRVFVILGGVEAKLSKTVEAPPRKEYTAVFIGRLHPQKGVTELIEIWRLVCQKSSAAKLALIGNGPLEKELQRKIHENHLNNNIFMFGFKDGLEKIRILKSSKVVVHPAVYDSGGMAACEAMACGLPGVSFDLPALRYYYPKGMIKVPCFSLEAFAKAILNLLDDQQLYEKTSTDALEWAQKWDWDNAAAETMDTVASLFEGNSGKS